LTGTDWTFFPAYCTVDSW